MANLINKTFCMFVVLASTSVLADSIDVKVTGTITPSACKPMISGNGLVDYGTISPDSLKKDNFTFLDEKMADFSIVCDAPTKLAIVATSGRGQTAVDNKGQLVNSSRMPLFGDTTGNVAAVGLGLDTNGKGVGGFGLRLQAGSMMADDQKVDSIQSDGNTKFWQKTTYGSVFSNGTPRYSTWAATGTLIPISFTILTGTLGVQAYINKTSELDLTKPVRLDGLATLEVFYL